MRVGVVVLGDVGRSPRMAYHALSIADAGHEVDLIGYSGSEPPDQVKSNDKISIKHIHKSPVFPALPRLLQYLLKAFFQSLYLLVCLPVMSKLDIILVQTPPGVPTLPVLVLYSILKGSRLIVDFHNYSDSILAMSCGPSHPLVKLTKLLEKFCGQTADAAFCVTKAMQTDLRENWSIEATVLHDRPPEKFRPITTEEKHQLFMRLKGEFHEFGGEDDNSTVFTEESNKEIRLRLNRPGLVVSSTSWTEDEDFSVLLSALRDYESRCQEEKLPDLICVITGKGDLKEFYLKKVAESNFKHIKVVTPWLSAEDYPTVLAAADIGVSLHTSSSGLDLPMKVVDMFGCCLPVAAIGFPAIGELVKDGENGQVFKSSSDLSQILTEWFNGFPSNPSEKHQKYRENLRAFREDDWNKNWTRNALPVLKTVHRQEGSPLAIFLFFTFLLLAFCSFVPTVQ